MTAALTLLTAPAILALVNLMKTVGLGGRWSALVAVLLGVGVALVEAYAPAQLVQTVAAGLIVGLGAAGLYDATNTTPPAMAGQPARRGLDGGVDEV